MYKEEQGGERINNIPQPNRKGLPRQSRAQKLPGAQEGTRSRVPAAGAAGRGKGTGCAVAEGQDGALGCVSDGECVESLADHEDGVASGRMGELVGIFFCCRFFFLSKKKTK